MWLIKTAINRLINREAWTIGYIIIRIECINPDNKIRVT